MPQIPLIYIMETRCDFLEKSNFSKTIDELRGAVQNEFNTFVLRDFTV